MKDLGPLAMNRMPPMRSVVLLATFTKRKPPSWYSVPFFVVLSKVPPLAIGASNHQLTPLLHWKRNDTGEMSGSATF